MADQRSVSFTEHLCLVDEPDEERLLSCRLRRTCALSSDRIFSGRRRGVMSRFPSTYGARASRARAAR
jgi:hypothetical protein